MSRFADHESINHGPYTESGWACYTLCTSPLSCRLVVQYLVRHHASCLWTSVLQLSCTGTGLDCSNMTPESVNRWSGPSCN